MVGNYLGSIRESFSQLRQAPFSFYIQVLGDYVLRLINGDNIDIYCDLIPGRRVDLYNVARRHAVTAPNRGRFGPELAATRDLPSTQYIAYLSGASSLWLPSCNNKSLSLDLRSVP